MEYSFIWAGRYHIVTGQNIEGFKIIPKASWGLSETIINLDAITGMPWIAAESQYPLSVEALHRAGYIMTPEEQEHERRVKEEMEWIRLHRDASK